MITSLVSPSSACSSVVGSQILQSAVVTCDNITALSYNCTQTVLDCVINSDVCGICVSEAQTDIAIRSGIPLLPSVIVNYESGQAFCSNSHQISDVIHQCQGQCSSALFDCLANDFGNCGHYLNAINVTGQAAIQLSGLFNPSVYSLLDACRKASIQTTSDVPIPAITVYPETSTCGNVLRQCQHDADCWSCFRTLVTVQNVMPLDQLRDLVTNETCLNNLIFQALSGPECIPLGNFPLTPFPVAGCAYAVSQCYAASNLTVGNCGSCVKKMIEAWPAGSASTEPAMNMMFGEIFNVFSSPACSASMDIADYSSYSDLSSYSDFFNVIYSCPAATVDGAEFFGLCQYAVLSCYFERSCSACLSFVPTANEVVIQSGPTCKTFVNGVILGCPQSYVRLLSCPSAVHANNVLVIITSVFGSLSIIGTLGVIAVILAYRKDRRSLRERILLGVFFGNFIYSIANAIPVGFQQTDSRNCGDSVFSDFKTSIRGIWFWGKYLLVMYELFVVFASVHALKQGANKFSTGAEIALHLTCHIAAILSFIIFIIGANGATDFTDTKQTAFLIQQQQQSIVDYNDVVQQTILVWVVLLGITILVWIYQKFVLYARLQAQWRKALEEAEESWAKDLWDIDKADVRRDLDRKRKLYQLSKEGYDEIAKPLEPYVAIFTLFGIPAIIMSTDFCVGTTSFTALEQLDCQHTCECVLALRTLASVAVYFREKKCREQIYGFRQLLLKLSYRINNVFGNSGDSVRFKKNVDVKRIIPTREVYRMMSKNETQHDNPVFDREQLLH